MWYIVSTDDIIAKTSTYREARQRVLSSCLDIRKYPDITRVLSGLYRYEQSSRADTERRKSYLIGTKKAFKTYGIDLETYGVDLDQLDS